MCFNHIYHTHTLPQSPLDPPPCHGSFLTSCLHFDFIYNSLGPISDGNLCLAVSQGFWELNSGLHVYKASTFVSWAVSLSCFSSSSSKSNSLSLLIVFTDWFLPKAHANQISTHFTSRWHRFPHLVGPESKHFPALVMETTSTIPCPRPGHSESLTLVTPVTFSQIDLLCLLSLQSPFSIEQLKWSFQE